MWALVSAATLPCVIARMAVVALVALTLPAFADEPVILSETQAATDDALRLALEARAQGKFRRASERFLRAFELQLLSHAGFEPQLERCARCQRAWRDDETAWLSLHHGTLACGPCRPTDEAPLEVAAALLARLERLKSQPLASARATPFTAMAAEAALLTGRLLALHLARPLQSVKLIEQLARADGSGRDPVTGQR